MGVPLRVIEELFLGSQSIPGPKSAGCRPASATPNTLSRLLRDISDQALAGERQRVDQLRERFRLEVRSVNRRDAQFDRLLQRWRAIPSNSTG